MKFEKKLLCHHSFLLLITEDDLEKRDCVSLVNDNGSEMSIFLGKDDTGRRYEVRIYKYAATENFIPNRSDAPWCMFKSNDEFSCFFFNHFINARQFTINLQTMHPEYEAHYTDAKS